MQTKNRFFLFQDYEGQYKAERLSRLIITLFGIVGLIWGYIIQQFLQTVYILGAGFVLACIVSVFAVICVGCYYSVGFSLQFLRGQCIVKSHSTGNHQGIWMGILLPQRTAQRKARRSNCASLYILSVVVKYMVLTLLVLLSSM